MNIVYSSDDNYARHLAASMTSLMDNNREAPQIRIWILNVGLSEENIRKLTQTAEHFGRELHVVDLHDLREKMPQKDLSLGEFTIEMYTRLFIADVLPATEHRAMYIDGDTAVLGDIRELYDCDIQGCWTAAVVDQPNFGLSVSLQDAELEPSGMYFASGMFVLDLDAWRREDMLSRFMQYLQDRESPMMFPDQCILNHVQHGHICKLPFRCHVITPAYFLTYRQMCERWGEPFYSKKEFTQGKRHPLVVHYAVFRPWKRRCLHPMTRYYRKYLKQTPYKGIPLEPNPLLPIVTKVVVTVLRRLHLIRT